MNTETVPPNVTKEPKPVSRVRGSRSTLVPSNHRWYEGHDLKQADMEVIWSVGRTPREAIEALCKARWNGTLEGALTPLPIRSRAEPTRASPGATGSCRTAAPASRLRASTCRGASC